MTTQRDGKREKFWRGMLRRRAASGMTIVDFCASEGLKATSYHYWQREIRRRDEESPSGSAESGRALLAAVHVVDDGGSRAAVEVVVRGGYVVRIGEQATTEHIRRVLQTISELE